MKNKMFKIIFLLCCVFLTASVALYCKNKSETVEAISYVSWGTRGQLVRDVQQALKNKGYYTGNVDGIYGTGTYNAIVSFQRDNGLTTDGIAGEATLSALGISSGTGSSGIGQTGQSNIDEDLYLLASAIHGKTPGFPYKRNFSIPHNVRWYLSRILQYIGSAKPLLSYNIFSFPEVGLAHCRKEKYLHKRRHGCPNPYNTLLPALYLLSALSQNRTGKLVLYGKSAKISLPANVSGHPVKTVHIPPAPCQYLSRRPMG